MTLAAFIFSIIGTFCVHKEGPLTLLLVFRLLLGLGLGGAATLLGRPLAVLAILDILLGTLARRCRLLGSGIAALAAVDLLLAATALLGSRRRSATVRWSHELLLEDSPGVAGRTRIRHTGEASELVVVDLSLLVEHRIKWAIYD